MHGRSIGEAKEMGKMNELETPWKERGEKTKVEKVKGEMDTRWR